MAISARCSPLFLVPYASLSYQRARRETTARASIRIRGRQRCDHRGVVWRLCCRPTFHRDSVWTGSSSNDRHQERTLVTRFASIPGKPAAMLLKHLKLKFASTSHCSALAQPRLRSCTCRGACSVNNVKRGTADGGACGLPARVTCIDTSGVAWWSFSLNQVHQQSTSIGGWRGTQASQCSPRPCLCWMRVCQAAVVSRMRTSLNYALNLCAPAI
jgi:hypothetical protein